MNMTNDFKKEVKLASEKQIQLFNSQINKNKYDFIGKDIKKLSSFEVSILIDYLMSGAIKDTDFHGEKLTSEQMQYRKDVINQYLKENQNKVVGMVSSKQVGFILKLLEDKDFTFEGKIKELSSKEASLIINHLTGQKEDAEIQKKYFKNKQNTPVEKDESLQDFEIDIPDDFNISMD